MRISETDILKLKPSAEFKKGNIYEQSENGEYDYVFSVCKQGGYKTFLEIHFNTCVTEGLYNILNECVMFGNGEHFHPFSEIIYGMELSNRYIYCNRASLPILYPGIDRERFERLIWKYIKSIVPQTYKLPDNIDVWCDSPHSIITNIF